MTRIARLLTAIFLVLVLQPANVAQAQDKTVKPQTKRVLYLVLDQLRPDFIERFDMQNVAKLMRDGQNFDNAYLGHMASETIISHNVMTSGQLPKDMGWQDEVFRDTENILGNGADTLHLSGSLTSDQYDTLIAVQGYRKASDYLKAEFPGTKFITVGEKSYAAYTAGGPTTDISVTFSGRSYDCDGDGAKNWRGPAGKNVPEYLTEPACGRFYVDSDKKLDYGTTTTDPAWLYPLDGNRYVPGFDQDHLGGDVWAADAAMNMMAQENWSGMLVTLAGIDKAGHMWGPNDEVRGEPGSPEEMAHLPYAAKAADEQVGRIMQQLQDLGQLDETLVVLTTDHGSQQAERYHGVNAPGRGDYNWYYGTTPEGSYLDPSPAIQPLLESGNVAYSFQDGAIRAWLRDTSDAAMRQAATTMATMPDTIASYYRAGDRYRLAAVNWGAMSWEEALWWLGHGQELVNTMAGPEGPDVVGLLKDNTSYGVAGDHGGHQRLSQEIPIVFYNPSLSGRDSYAPARTVDILPTVLRFLGIAGDRDLDGRGYRLN